MPRPRFERLAAEKQEAILAAAAQEFAAYGYAQASLNRILELAGISKGAAYYYFDDKADLYMTAVRHYSAEIMNAVSLDLENLSAETFWPTITDLYGQQFSLYRERPWVLGLTKSGGPISPDELASGPLADFWQEMQSTVIALLQMGQSVGQVRTDLPEELLVALMIAVDDAHDRWLFGRETAVDAQAAAERITDLWQRLLKPAE